MEAAQAQSQLAQTLKQTRQLSEGYLADLGKQATRLQELTGIQDDEISRVQRVLIANKVQKQDIEDITRLTLDLAAARNISAEAAAQALGRGLSGEDIELGRLGVRIDKDLTREEQIRRLKEQLGGTVGGQAAVQFEAKGPVGELQVMLDQLKQTAGEVTLIFAQPFAAGFREGLGGVMDMLERIKQELPSISDGFSALVQAAGFFVGANLTWFGPLVISAVAVKAAIQNLRPFWVALEVGAFAVKTAVEAMVSTAAKVLVSLGPKIAAISGALSAAATLYFSYGFGNQIAELELYGASIKQWLASFILLSQSVFTEAAKHPLIWWERTKNVFQGFYDYLTTTFVGAWKTAQATILQSTLDTAEKLNKALPSRFRIDTSALAEAKDKLISEVNALDAELDGKRQARDRATSAAIAGITKDWDQQAAIYRQAADAAGLDKPRKIIVEGQGKAASVDERTKAAYDLKAELEKGSKAAKDSIAQAEFDRSTNEQKLEILQAQRSEVEAQLQSQLKVLEPIHDQKAEALAHQAARAKTLDIEAKIAAVERDQFKAQQDLLDAELQKYRLQVKAIQDDPYKTKLEKQAEILPLLEKENQLIEESIRLIREKQLADPNLDPATRELAQQRLKSLETDQVDLQGEMTANTSLGFSDRMRADLTDLMSQWEDTAARIANVITNTIQGAVRGLSDSIEGLIRGTMTWGEAFVHVGQVILDTFIRVVAEFIAQQIMMFILRMALGKAFLATAVSEALTLSQIWAAPATLATIASYGGAAIAAPFQIGGAISGTMGTALAGFAEGGYTGEGNKWDVAGVVHRGEYVIPKADVDRIGVDAIEGLRFARSPVMGYASGGFVSASSRTQSEPMAAGSSGRSTLILVDNRRDALRALRDSEGRATIRDMFSGMQHEFAV